MNASILMSRRRQKLATFVVPVGWTDILVLKDAEKDGSGLKACTDAPLLFTERALT